MRVKMHEVAARSPRLIMRYAATGESIPPDSSAIPRPVTPTGRPPAPGILPADTYAASFIISIDIVSSGSLEIDFEAERLLHLAADRAIDFHRVHREAFVLAPGPTANVRAMLPRARLIASRVIASISRAVG